MRKAMKTVEIPYILGRKLSEILPPRPENSHKYMFGSLLLIGGSRGMTGAIAMSAIAAMRSGAGLATVACPDCERAIIAGLVPEAMTFGAICDDGTFAQSAADEILEFASRRRFSAVLIGPGMSCTDSTSEFTSRLLSGFAKMNTVSPDGNGNIGMPLVIDADALNCVARIGGFDRINGWKRQVSTIITPHEGEAARILGRKVESGFRENAVMELATLCGGTAVLKGHGTLVCDGKDIFRNETGGSELAKGGSGDILAGIAASLLMQNGIMRGFTSQTTFGSAALAVWIHGMCGYFAAERYGRRCVLPTDLPEFLPNAFRLLE